MLGHLRRHQCTFRSGTPPRLEPAIVLSEATSNIASANMIVPIAIGVA
jgi:hypothetical protein